MRKIVFRGYNVEAGWVYGSLLTDPCRVEILNYENDGIPLSVNPSTIGQYTGLKDRNGTEIYEGDILRGALHNHVVKFKNGAFMADVNDEHGYDFIEPKMFKATEIIGNIHDNKIKEE